MSSSIQPHRTVTLASASTQHDVSKGGGEGGGGSLLTKCWTSKSRVHKGRVVFVLCLATTAALLGLLAHTLLASSETRLAREQFEAISDSGLEISRDIAQRQRLGIVTLASIAEQGFPSKDEWPFVDIRGFEVIAKNVIETSSGQALGLLPFVTPEQLVEFNAFGSALYPDAPFDRVTGLDSTTFERYNETLESNGGTAWGSPYTILAPFLYHSQGPVLFLANLHSLESQGRNIDNMIDCAKQRAMQMSLQNNNGTADSINHLIQECSVLSDVVDLAGKTPIENPAAVTYLPVYPANDPAQLVGFISSAVKWQNVLVKVFSSTVSGVDCVLQTQTQVFTYHIANGEATLKGEGDLHSRQFSSFGRTIALVPPGVYSNASATYTLSVFPSDHFFETYATANPAVATALAVFIIILTSVLFFVYDSCVRREFSDKKDLLEARRQFVRFISHEVRTPLNSVCMGLHLLKDEANKLFDNNSDAARNTETATATCVITKDNNGAPSLEKQLTAVTDISEAVLINALSAVDVLDEILNYDKVESGSLNLELTVVNIWDLIEQTCLEFRQQANSSKISTYELDFSPLLLGEPANPEQPDDIEKAGKNKETIACASQLPQHVMNGKVLGDKSRISQVLRNLLSNALKFTPEHGSLKVRTLWKQPTGDATISEFKLHSGDFVEFQGHGSLQLEVTDTGVGMSVDQMKNLFREGVQFNVNELQAGKGSGLGLFIAKGMVEAHGGSLLATSAGLGCGTTFTMTIPLYFVPDSADTHGSKDDKPVAADPTTMEFMNVLVVDDAEMNRKLLKRLLQNRGHTCDEATDGRVAVQRVRDAEKARKPYDSILLDYMMPEMDGPTAAKKIRELGCSSFIVGITGNYFAEDIANFENCGADVVLSKPLNLQQLTNLWMEHGVGT